MIEPENAMRQAHMTSAEYACETFKTLCRLLDIDEHGSSSYKRERLAPFAPVWAAMIEAAARDFDTAMRSNDAERALERAGDGS